MTLPNALVSTRNLALALDRVIRGSNRDYKQYFRHLYPSYSLAQPALLASLSTELKNGTYDPTTPSLVYQPKKSGILRPLALLTLKDQIVYQAVLNRIASRVHGRQRKLALKKRFGALYAGKNSRFFFRSWKVAYAAYNRAITKAFTAGRQWVAEFDLVSCYELIDHNLLRARLAGYGVDHETVGLLCTCLAKWTTNASGSHVRHGLPQGPEASAFLAECVLFSFDSLQLGRNLTYLRYVDDIRLLAKARPPLAKALLRLDLESKDLGLVPQAQKIGIRFCKSLTDVIKTVPSAMVAPRFHPAKNQPSLLKLWRKSLGREQRHLIVRDQTAFRFSLYRLNPRRLVLRRVSSLLLSRPDLISTVAHYFSRFPQDQEAADLLLAALRQDPAYDFAAAACIDALDVCEPTTATAPYRRVIRTAKSRSVERSIVLEVAALRFRTRRIGITEAIKALQAAPQPHVVGLVLSSICAETGGSPFAAAALLPLLETLVVGPDPDLARFAAALALEVASKAGRPWRPPRALNPAVAELLVAVGLRSRGPVRRTAVEIFFDRQGVIAPLKWKKALGADLPDLERRAVRLQHLRLLDPSAFVLMLDTFNEGLLQAFSLRHPALTAPFKAAAGTKTHPDYGNWLNNGALVAAIPKAVSWLHDVHSLRVQADLAHAKLTKGPTKGKPTKAVTYQQVDQVMRRAPGAWEALVHEWRTIL